MHAKFEELFSLTGQAMIFREHITWGQGCANGGTLRLVQQGDTLLYRGVAGEVRPGSRVLLGRFSYWSVMVFMRGVNGIVGLGQTAPERPVWRNVHHVRSGLSLAELWEQLWRERTPPRPLPEECDRLERLGRVELVRSREGEAAEHEQPLGA